MRCSSAQGTRRWRSASRTESQAGQSTGPGRRCGQTPGGDSGAGSVAGPEGRLLQLACTDAQNQVCGRDESAQHDGVGENA